MTETKNRLSALLDLVRHGETVLIEDRGVAVAQIGAVGGGDIGLDADRLARLERSGIIGPARSVGASEVLLTRPPRPDTPVVLSALVSDERAGGW